MKKRGRPKPRAITGERLPPTPTVWFFSRLHREAWMVEITAGLWAIVGEPPEYPPEDAPAEIVASVERDDANESNLVDAIRVLGPAAVIEPPDHEFATSDGGTKLAPAPEPAGLQRVRRRVIARLWQLHAEAKRPGDTRSADKARRAMSRMMLAAVPDGRGKRQGRVDDFAVRRHYYLLHFWLDRASRMLRQWKTPMRSRDEKLKIVACACGLDFERIRNCFLVSDDGARRPDVIAVEWTAEDFRIDEPTVRKKVKRKTRLK